MKVAGWLSTSPVRVVSDENDPSLLIGIEEIPTGAELTLPLGVQDGSASTGDVDVLDRTSIRRDVKVDRRTI